MVDNRGNLVIIDCHGHYTTTPPPVGERLDAGQSLELPPE